MAKQDVELKFSLIDGVSRGLAQIQQGVSGLGASLVKVNAAAELTGKAFGALGSIAGAFGDAVSGAASVEDALKRVSIITRATTEEQAALQQAVSDAVATTRFSAEEAAGALVLMAEDGFTASEAVKQLGTVLQFAQANAQSAATAAQALGAVLDTFGAPATQISALADALTATSVAAGTSTKALQEGLAGVGNAATQAGISLNDTIGYLGLLASRGIEGGDAVGKFNKIIREIEDPASKAGKALNDLGLRGADFGTVLKRLGGDSAAAEKLLSALGKNPREAMRILLQEGGGDLGKFAEILNQSAGASSAASDALNTTFLGALTRLQNQLVEARNQFLTPLLAPLAAEFEAFSAKIAAFTSSDQFKILSGQFAAFVTEGVGALGDKLAKIDFNDVATKISNFATGAGDTIQKFKVIIDATAGAIGAIGAAFDFAAQKVAAFDALFVGSEANWNRYNAAVARGTKGLDDHQKSLQAARDAAKKFQAQATATASGADAFGNSLDQLGIAANRTSEDLRRVPEAAKLTEAGVGAAAAAASSAAQSIDQLEASLAAVKKQLEAAPVGSPEFVALSQQAAELEAKIKGARAAIDDASKSNENLANSANNAANALRNQASAADSASQSGANLSGSNSQVADSFGNIGNQSSETAVSMGNLTEEYVRNALAAAGNAKSTRDYMDTLNRFFDAAKDQERTAQRRLDMLNRQNASLSEEEQIRRRIEQQYGTATTLTEQIVQAEIRLHNQLRANNAERERGIELAQQAAGVAGGIGNQPRGPVDAGTSAAGGKGSGDGAGKGATVINVNVQGLPSDRDSWRGIVRDLIEPELRNLRALGK